MQTGWKNPFFFECSLCWCFRWDVLHLGNCRAPHLSRHYIVRSRVLFSPRQTLTAASHQGTRLALKSDCEVKKVQWKMDAHVNNSG